VADDEAAEDVEVAIDNGTSSPLLLSDGLNMSDGVAETEVLACAIDLRIHLKFIKIREFYHNFKIRKSSLLTVELLTVVVK